MTKATKTILAVVLSIALLAGCAPTGTSSSSQTNGGEPSDTPQPVTVTMFGFWSDNASDIAVRLQAAISAKHPEITLEYEAFPTGSKPYTDELTRRIDHGKEADLFMTVDSSLWDSGALLDLTNQEFVGRYSVATMQRLSGNGSAYFLPGIGDVICYAYNSDHISQAPKTLDELELITDELKSAGGHPFIVPYEQTQALFIKALAAGYLASPAGQIWLEGYSTGKVTMAESAEWQAIWARAQRMIDGGVLTSEDMVFAESRRTNMLAEGVGSMSTISSSLINFLKVDPQQESKFNLIPLLGEKPENKTVFSAPTCYFAASSRLEEAGNEQKKEAALKILDFISTDEGQNIICGTSPLANSYLNGTQLPLDTKYQAVADTLQAGLFSPMPVFGRGVESVIGEVFGKMLTGEMTSGQAIAACDQKNADYVIESGVKWTPLLLGTALEEFPWTFKQSRTQELAITNLVIDSVRAAAGTDMAIELGTAVRSELFEGDITTDDVASVVRVDKKIYRAQISGQQIWDIIEQGVKTTNSSWFIVVSGLKYSYQPAQGEVAGKLLSLTTTDGNPVEMDKTYTIAVSENQMMEVSNIFTFFNSPAEEVGLMLREAVTEQILAQGTISPIVDGRIEQK